MRTTLLAFLLLGFSTTVFTQESGDEITLTPDYTEDTKSPESLMLAALDVISGPKDEPREWERFRNLFLPSAQLGITGKGPNGESRHRMFGLEDFIKNNGPSYARTGFFETELGHKLEKWNGIASAMQAYKWTIPDTDQMQRGVNNYQFIQGEGRWYITNLIFTNETEQNPIPETYIKSRDYHE